MMNYVFPVTQIKDNGYDEDLMDKFEIQVDYIKNKHTMNTYYTSNENPNMDSMPNPYNISIHEQTQQHK